MENKTLIIIGFKDYGRIIQIFMGTLKCENNSDFTVYKQGNLNILKISGML